MALIRSGLALWVGAVARAAWFVIAASVASAAVGTYYSASHLAMFTDTTDMLSPELPFRRYYDDYKAAFPHFSDNIIAVIDGDNADVVEDAGLALAQRLRARPDLFPYVFDPAGDPFFIRNGLLYLDLEELSDLSARLASAQPLLGELARDMSLRGLFGVLGLAADEVAKGASAPATISEILARLQQATSAALEGRPYVLSWRELMSGRVGADDLRRVIVVQPRLDYSTLYPARAALDAARQLARDLPLPAGAEVRVRLTGSAALQEEELESVANGAELAGVLSLALVTVLLAIGLQSVRLIVATLITLIIGLAWSVTFAALAIGHLNLISVTFAVLFIGVGVDFGIQFCLRYREAAERGERPPAALSSTALGVGGALTLAAATAAIGFFSFAPTAYVGLAELGIISGASMFIAWFANLTVLPALLALIPVDHPRPLGLRAGTRSRSAMRFVLDHAGQITLGATLVGIAVLWLAPKAQFDFNPLNLNDPTTESVQTYRDLMRQNPGAAYTIAVLAPDLEAAQRLADRLDDLSEVKEALTLADFVPGGQDEKMAIIEGMKLFLFPVFAAGESPAPPASAERARAVEAFREALYRLADSPKAETLASAARRLADDLGRLAGEGRAGDRLTALEAGLLATLPGRLEKLRLSLKAAPFGRADLPDQVKGRAVAGDGRALVTVVPARDVSDNKALREFVTAVRGIAPEATDNPVVILEAGDAVLKAFKEAGLYAVVGILAVLLLVTRSLVDTVFVLTPLGLAAALTVAVTVAFDIPFNFANIIAVPLLFSLGVGYGIYLVLRHRATAAVSVVLATYTPRAVLFSALTTMCSFGTLAVSSHRGTSSMGVLLAVSLTLAVSCTLIVLPAMQELRDRRARRLGERSGR